jgi:hypothetical protein
VLNGKNGNRAKLNKNVDENEWLSMEKGRYRVESIMILH